MCLGNFIRALERKKKKTHSMLREGKLSITHLGSTNIVISK